MAGRVSGRLPCLLARPGRTAALRPLYSTAARTRTHYNVLGLARGASPEEVRAAFVRLSKRCHPDLNPGLKDAQSKSAKVNEAYGILGNASRRTLYDRELWTVERHRAAFAASYPHSGYAGSAANDQTSSPFGGSNTDGAYSRNGAEFRAHQYGFSEVEWEHWHRESVRERRRGHRRVVGYLIVFMLTAGAVQAARIRWSHRKFQERSEMETRQNIRLYAEVRERARSRSVEEQLNTLSQRHARLLSDHAAAREKKDES